MQAKQSVNVRICAKRTIHLEFSAHCIIEN